MEHPYGFFNEAGDEFVVTNPKTPRAFDNFLWNDSLFSNLQQTGVGYCDYQIDGLEAVQLLTGNGRVCDFDIFGRDSLMSRLVYIRDNDTGAYWNLGWEPVCAPYQRYSCRHGLGYTVLENETQDILGEMTVLVPPGKDPVELWKLRLLNTGSSPRNLSVFVYCQFQFRYKWGFDSYGDMLFRSSDFDRTQNAVVVSKHPHIRPHNYLTGFLTSDLPIAAFDGTREAFVGTYASLQNPRAVVEGHCSNTPGSSDATIGAAEYQIRLNPGAEQEISFIMGVVKAQPEIDGYRKKYLGQFAQTLDTLRTEKQKLLHRFQVKTPDLHLNRMLNYWIKEQALFGAAWCRWGWNGYRDIVQHGFGVSSLQPTRTRAILLEALSYQYKSGLALRGYNPPDTKPYSDSALWLTFTLVQYIRETGDCEILSRVVPFYDGESDSVLGHITRSLDFLEEHKGAHGLCLIKFGDWNDSLTAVGKDGKGESVWLSEAYGEALRRMEELFLFLGQKDTAAAYRKRYQTIKETINRTAWDGEWYNRCFDDNGRAIGSDADPEGKLFGEAQAWAMIAGIADGERMETMMKSCYRELLTPQGFKLLSPTFTHVDERIGRITCMEPGICENGTIYSHVNIWFVLGLLRYGKAEEAYDIFKRFTAGYLDGEPHHKQLCPPYVYANCYYGPDHKNNAWQMEFAWITGSISWILNSMLGDFLGVQADFQGLRIAPCIPKDWASYEVTRQFRGAQYEITVENPERISRGKISLTVDGAFVPGEQIPAFETGVHRVRAVLTAADTD